MFIRWSFRTCIDSLNLLPINKHEQLTLITGTSSFLRGGLIRGVVGVFVGVMGSLGWKKARRELVGVFEG